MKSIKEKGEMKKQEGEEEGEEVSISVHHSGQGDKQEGSLSEDSQDYEVDEKNNIIIDSRIKFFLISLENWLFDSSSDSDDCP